MESEKTTPPPRLNFLFAEEVPYGVVIRRGPAKVCATFGWDLSTDTFTLGQWIKGRIYVSDSDITPDGKHTIYKIQHQHSPQEWTVISRTPYLKALVFIRHRYSVSACNACEFLDNKRYYLVGWHSPEIEYAHGNFQLADSLPEKPRKRRFDGWVSQEKKFSQHLRAEKALPFSWTLRRVYDESLSLREESPRAIDESYRYSLIRGNAVEVHDEWEWADWDAERERLLFVREGKIFAVKFTGEKLGKPVLLYDFNGMEFQPIAAPY